MILTEPYNINITPYQSIDILHGDAQIDIYKQTQKPRHTLALFSGFAETDFNLFISVSFTSPFIKGAVCVSRLGVLKVISW